jgi:peptide/nickel transport system permease protein
MAAVGIPVFWLAILCVYLFGLKLGWLPIQGYVSPFEDPWESLRHAVLPVLVLSVGLTAVLARQTRSSLLEVIEQDYMRTAWAKGLKERRIVLQHGLKNALIPIITLVGMVVPIMVGGTVLVETVFNISGMGRLMVTAVFNKDYIVVQSVVLIVAVVTVLCNLLVDIAHGWVDPRIRYS